MDILVNNAANDDRHRVADVTPAYWDERLAVNLRHYFFCAQSVLPGMRATGRGVIINVGSISWHLALPEIAVYQTAKAGIGRGLTRAMARTSAPPASGSPASCGQASGRRDRWQWATKPKARMVGQQCLRSASCRRTWRPTLFLASDDADVHRPQLLRRWRLAVMPECLWDLQAALGRGADLGRSRPGAWFVDIKGRRLHRYDR